MNEFKKVGCRMCIVEHGDTQIGKLPSEQAFIHGQLYLCKRHLDEVHKR